MSLIERMRKRADNLDLNQFERADWAEAADEIERLQAGMKTVNANAERHERLWYLRGDEIERLREMVDRLPRDAEGNPISLRDVRYNANGWKVVAWKIGVEYVFGQDGSAYKPNSLYGSPEAAERARKQ